MISVRLDFLAQNLVLNQKPSDPQINVRSSKHAGDTNLCTNRSARGVLLIIKRLLGNLGNRKKWNPLVEKLLYPPDVYAEAFVLRR